MNQNMMYSTHSHNINYVGMNMESSKMYNNEKRFYGAQPESLFSMAMYDLDATPVESMEPLPAHQPSSASAAFHPVDEYKDMSLRELLDLTDDFLFDSQANAADVLAPTPLNIPDCQTVAQITSIYSERPTMVSPPLAPISMNLATVIPDVMKSAESKKRKRQVEEEDEDDEDDLDEDGLNKEGRFRSYQAGQWSDRFDDLVEYRKRTGNCLVPHTFEENLPLARWVKRQRYQYKLMMEKKASTMTEERVKALEEIGFVWDSQGAAWGERLNELKEFRNNVGHSNVPSNFTSNPQLATWVKCQRRQYKLYMEGKPSNMTQARIQELEDIGFEWLLRSYKKTRTC
jgi:hypothetical protein